MNLPVSDQQKTQYWARHLAAVKNSGLSMKAYCDKHSLSYHTMAYHRTKQNKENSSKTPVKSAGFAAVSVKPEVSRSNYPDPIWLAKFLKAFGDE